MEGLISCLEFHSRIFVKPAPKYRRFLKILLGLVLSLEDGWVVPLNVDGISSDSCCTWWGFQERHGRVPHKLSGCRLLYGVGLQPFRLSTRLRHSGTCRGSPAFCRCGHLVIRTGRRWAVYSPCLARIFRHPLSMGSGVLSTSCDHCGRWASLSLSHDFLQTTISRCSIYSRRLYHSGWLPTRGSSEAVPHRQLWRPTPGLSFLTPLCLSSGGSRALFPQDLRCWTTLRQRNRDRNP